MISRIAVFCGSKSGNNPLYQEHTIEIGKWMAAKKLTLIYGGGNIGLMGTIANSVLEGGGKVVGVIPEVLVQWEVGHQSLTELHVVADMHVRKKMMYELCYAAIILPGGIGTLDELFEMLTWNSLKIHDKKIILLNTAGYYNHLIKHLDVMETEGFLHETWKERLLIATSPKDINDFFGMDKS